jgi:hypothetical protein
MSIRLSRGAKALHIFLCEEDKYYKKLYKKSEAWLNAKWLNEEVANIRRNGNRCHEIASYQSVSGCDVVFSLD